MNYSIAGSDKEAFGTSAIVRHKITYLDYFLIFLFIVDCGFTSGDLIPGKNYIIILFGLVYMLRHIDDVLSKIKIPIIMTSSLFVVLIIHRQQFGEWDQSLSRCILYSIAGFLLIVMMKDKFRITYLNIMAFIAAISVICYVLMLFANIVPNIGVLNSRPDSYRGIFIWNARLGEITGRRNCGPFWEPGAFSGYLLMVFVLYINNWKLLWRTQRKKTIIILLALITTFSSQGYLSAFILIGVQLLLNAKSSNFFRLGLTAIVIAIGLVFLYNTLPFLKQKVDDQLELTEDWDSDNSLQSANRFTTTMVDNFNIQKRPLWGSSSDPYILYEDFPFITNVVTKQGAYGTGSGVTGFIAQNGIILFIIWLYMSYRSFNILYRRKLTSILLLLMLLSLGQGEAYMAYIFYQSFPYLRFTKKKQ